MTSQTWPGWLESEAQVKAHIASRHQEELGIIKNLLGVFWAGFATLNSSANILRQGDRLDRAWSLLIVRSFDSLACAYDVLQRGYYSQAMALTRSVDEDWLTCKDCTKSSKTLAALLGEGEKPQQRMPKYADMARRLDEPYDKEWWDSIYGWNSKFAHARHLALSQLLNPTMNGVRVGPYYDSDVILVSCYLLVTSAFRMVGILMQLLQRVISPMPETWVNESRRVLQQAEV